MERKRKGVNSIEVFTFLTKNSADYAELLRASMEKLKSGNYNIGYRCIESVGCDRIPEGWDCVASTKDNLGHNCLNHADAMHEALNHITSPYVIFVDADMCIMCKDWDSVLFRYLTRVDVWGTAFGDDSKQYHKFPNVFFFAFKKSVLDVIDLDFNPKLIDGIESPVREKITSPRKAKAFNKKVGDIIKCDTGYKLPWLIYQYGISNDYIKRVLGKEPGSLLPYRDLKQKELCNQKPEHMAEWHVVANQMDGNEVLFATHKQASRNHPLDGEWGSVWKDRINLYFKKEHGFVL